MAATDVPMTKVLMVEDNPADVALFAEAVLDVGVALRIHTVSDGLAALAFLRGQEGRDGVFRPDVIVLDLNLPIRNGKDVLAELTTDPRLRDIPVAVLTTSKSESDICRRYPASRMLYFAKTAEFHELVGIVRRIVDFAASNRGHV